MYPVMIVTFLAAIYLSMMSPKQLYNDPVTDGPDRGIANVALAQSDDLGVDLAIFGAGVQNMVTRLLMSPQGRTDLVEEMAANAGTWVVDWDEIQDFFAASGNGNDYRQTLIVPAVPSSEALRASFFKPGYGTYPGFDSGGVSNGPRGPWRALVVRQTIGGVAQNDVAALIIFADTSVAGFRPNDNNIGGMIGGMLRMMNSTALVGMSTDTGSLVSRGYVTTHTLTGTEWVPTGVGRALVDGLPAAIPAMAPVHLVCMRGSVPPLAYCDS